MRRKNTMLGTVLLYAPVVISLVLVLGAMAVVHGHSVVPAQVKADAKLATHLDPSGTVSWREGGV